MPVNRSSRKIDQLDSPGSESQRLPTVRPEPSVETIANRKQIKRKKILIGSERLARIERQNNGGGKKPDRQQQQGIVKNGTHSTQKARRRNGFGAGLFSGFIFERLQLLAEQFEFLPHVHTHGYQRADH